MASGDDDPPTDDEGGVLSPEELDITEEDNVVELDDGRYVISPNDKPDVPNTQVTDPDPPTTADQTSPSPSEGHAELTQESVHKYLREQMAEAEAAYGFDVTAHFDGSVARQELYSDDVVTTFEGLLVWYAQHAGGTTPIEEVLGILLVEANVPIRYPPSTVKALVSSLDLESSDSIADLLSAVENADHVRFPPET